MAEEVVRAHVAKRSRRHRVLRHSTQPRHRARNTNRVLSRVRAAGGGWRSTKSRESTALLTRRRRPTTVRPPFVPTSVHPSPFPMRLRLVGQTLLAGHLVAAAAVAQPAAPRDSVRDDARFSFYARGPYRPNVPRPESILGYNVGAMNTQFAMQERTLLAIADAAKDRVHVEEIGTTNERRTMRIYIISAPENIQRL